LFLEFFLLKLLNNHSDIFGDENNCAYFCSPKLGGLKKAESSLKVWKQQQHKTLSFMLRFAAIKKYTQKSDVNFD